MKYYGIIGDCACHEDATNYPVCPDGMIEMNAPYPAQGYFIATPDGDWVASKPSVNRSEACALIDLAAGRARTLIAGDSRLIEAEYQRVYQQAIAFIHQDYKGETPTMVQSHVEAFQVTSKEAADTIAAKGDRWFQLLEIIRDCRLKGKKTVERAEKVSDFRAIAQPFIDKLAAIQP